MEEKPVKVVLDTHSVLWWSFQPDLLGRAAHRAIEKANELGVPTIVFWEISLLVRRKKIALGMPVVRWIDLILSVDRVVALDLTVGIAIRAEALEMHPDPADRFIVATALENKSLLVTKDRALRQLSFVETVW